MSEALRILEELIGSCKRQLAAGVGDLKRIRAQLETYERDKKALEEKK